MTYDAESIDFRSVETRQRLIKIKRGVDPLSIIRSSRSVAA
jgi:hypothetical protein